MTTSVSSLVEFLGFLVKDKLPPRAKAMRMVSSLLYSNTLWLTCRVAIRLVQSQTYSKTTVLRQAKVLSITLLIDVLV